MEDIIASVRRFNRFYTRLIGALDANFLESGLSLAEARILFEIAKGEGIVAADLQANLRMDAGYVSRILRRFEAQGLIERGRGEIDGRRRPIALTEAGSETFDLIDARQRQEVVRLIDGLGSVQRADLMAALTMAQALLEPDAPRSFSIQTFRTGDAALIAARQSILYEESHGWGRGLETVESEVTAAFLRNFKPGREQCWVAEVDGLMAGSIFLTDEGDGLSRLRLLYVEPFARRMGIGDALVRTCIDFARERGYRAITLWTHTVLESARRIYAAQGFRIIETKMHQDFGEPVQGETWRLDLS